MICVSLGLVSFYLLFFKYSDLSLNGSICFAALRKHDVAFLVTVRPMKTIGTRYDPKKEHFIEQVGLVYVRGCEIEGMLDEEGRVIEEGMLNSFFHFS